MNINRKRQSQFELFPGTDKPAMPPQGGKSARFIKDLTLSAENIIVSCIIFVMALVLFFSFGVERGKRMIAAAPEEAPAVIVKTRDEVSGKQAADPKETAEEGKRVVFPVQVPEEVTGDDGPQDATPVEQLNGQEDLFTIQVASFKTREYAEKEADRLKEGGHADSFVVPKGNYTIVCVGKFAERNEAKQFSKRLKRKYNDCLVRRL